VIPPYPSNIYIEQTETEETGVGLPTVNHELMVDNVEIDPLTLEPTQPSDGVLAARYREQYRFAGFPATPDEDMRPAVEPPSPAQSLIPPRRARADMGEVVPDSMEVDADGEDDNCNGLAQSKVMHILSAGCRVN
jgi:hypothetical protein